MDEIHTKKLWFKRRRYGWGWVPVTWQGWVSLLVYILAVLAVVQPWELDRGDRNLLIQIVSIGVFTGLLILLCYKKGEKPKWTWGGK